MRIVGHAIAILAAGTLMAFGQAGNSGSGAIAHLEGRVYVDDRPAARDVVPKANSVIRTEGGRAEIRFADGVTLFIGENTSVRLTDKLPVSGHFEILDGAAVVTTRATGTAAGCDDTVELSESGVFRFDMRRDAPDEYKCKLRVFHGSASVQLASLVAQLMPGGMIHLNRRCGDMVPTHNFKVEETDALDRWSRQRQMTPPTTRASTR
jgi:hypothetical protein